MGRSSTAIHNISMSKMNFILTEMTFLRYYIPLIIEANSRDIICRVFVRPNNKYNNPLKYKGLLRSLSGKYNFNLYDCSELQNYFGTTFLVEGCGRELLNAEKHKSLSLTYMTDFSVLYKNYINDVDHVIFPSKFWAEYYKQLSDKNLYLGSPKYDIDINVASVLKKYNLSKNKKALVLAPRIRDMGKINLQNIYNILIEKGYEVLVKTRGKDKLLENLHGTRYFEDESWFPHTSLELMKVSDFVINFDSTAIKECVMSRTPVINYNIKPFEQPLKFLYEYDYCINLNEKIVYTNLYNHIDNISNITNEDFSDAIQNHLFENNASNSILNYLEK